MHLHIKLLRASNAVLSIFHTDGWHVAAGHPDGLDVSHVQVPDEAAARLRLHHLGLLTSSCLRIDFLAS
jgi:hypothetical protein